MVDSVDPVIQNTLSDLIYPKTTVKKTVKRLIERELDESVINNIALAIARQPTVKDRISAFHSFLQLNLDVIQNLNSTKHTDRRFLCENIVFDDRETLTHLKTLVKGLCHEAMVREHYLVTSLAHWIIPNLQLQEEGKKLVEYNQEYAKVNKTKRKPKKQWTIHVTTYSEGEGKDKHDLMVEQMVFRQNTYKSYLNSMSKDVFTGHNLTRVGAFAIKELRSGIERYSGIAVWKLYDTHIFYGKHAYLDILCSHTDYSENKKQKENREDFYSDIKLEESESWTAFNTEQFGSAFDYHPEDIGMTNEDDETKSEKEYIKGLGTICLWAMMVESYIRGYSSIVLSVARITDTLDDNMYPWPVNDDAIQPSTEAVTIEYYKKQGFVIIGDKREFEVGEKLNNGEADASTDYYVMLKVMTRLDFLKIVRNMFSFLDSKKLLI